MHCLKSFNSMTNCHKELSIASPVVFISFLYCHTLLIPWNMLLLSCLFTLAPTQLMMNPCPPTLPLSYNLYLSVTLFFPSPSFTFPSPAISILLLPLKRAYYSSNLDFSFCLAPGWNDRMTKYGRMWFGWLNASSTNLKRAARLALSPTPAAAASPSSSPLSSTWQPRVRNNYFRSSLNFNRQDPTPRWTLHSLSSRPIIKWVYQLILLDLGRSHLKLCIFRGVS